MVVVGKEVRLESCWNSLSLEAGFEFKREDSREESMLMFADK